MTDLTREGLVELADRVEQGTGPDRFLDMEIHDALCDGFDMMPDATPEQLGEFLPAGMDAQALIEELGGFAVVRVPPYTEDRIGTAIDLRARAMEAGRG